MTIPVNIGAGMIKQFRSEELDGLEGLVPSIVFGSFTILEELGHPEPVFFFDEETSTSLNCVGLKNPCLESFLRNDLEDIYTFFHRHTLKDGFTTRIRLSLAPRKLGEVGMMARHLNENTRACELIDAVEIDASCVNVRNLDMGVPRVLASDPVALELLMMEGQAYGGMKLIKIPPEMSDDYLKQVMFLVQKYNYKGIVSSNTKQASSTFNGVRRLSQATCGMGGESLLEKSLEQMKRLNDLRKKRKLDITLVGSGGILNADAVQKYESAGADEVQVATLYYKYGVRGVQDLMTELYT